MFDMISSFVFADPWGLLVQIFFAWTIVSMITDDQKPPLKTSIPTGIALIVLAVSGSFAAPFVSILSVLNGTLWLVLGYQRHKQHKA